MSFLGAWRALLEKNRDISQFEGIWERLVQSITQTITMDFTKFFEKLTIVQAFTISNYLLLETQDSFEEVEKIVRDKIEPSV